MGNLNFRTTSDTLTDHLAPAGEIVDVYVATDRDTGRPRGFAFVTFAEEAQAMQAIRMFNGVELDGRPLNINEARERERDGRPPPRKSRPFTPKDPPPLDGGGFPRNGFRDDFRATVRDEGDFDIDGSSWSENRESHWGDDGFSDDDGGRQSKGRRNKPKTKGSRRRLRARKRGFS